MSISQSDLNKVKGMVRMYEKSNITIPTSSQGHSLLEKLVEAPELGSITLTPMEAKIKVRNGKAYWWKFIRLDNIPFTDWVNSLKPYR